MKNNNTNKKRNTKNIFFYLKYPTFLIRFFHKGKFYFKCFSCQKYFPTKYRLSRRFIYSRCLLNNPLADHNKIKKYKQAKKFKYLNIQYSDLKIYNEKFLRKKNEMITLFQGPILNDKITSNAKNKDYDINFRNECQKILINILNNKDNYLGGGSYCNVFVGESLKTKSFIALKKPKNEIKSISQEINLLKILKGITGIPQLINYMNEKNNKAIITNLCGPSIDKLHFFCDFKFSEVTILLIAINIIKILKSIHEAGVIHRDLKPSNICYGSFSSDKQNNFDKSIKLIDFGLGKIYSPKILRSNDIKKTEFFVGTLMFASTSALSGLEQEPRDDIESLFYVMIYLKNGTLPWLKYKNKGKKEYLESILKMHYDLSEDFLFEGFSKEVKFIFKSIKNLKPKETLDYELYIQNFESAIEKLKLKNNNSEIKYDWEKKLEKIYSDISNFRINREDLSRVSYLKKGYPLSLEDFLKIFKQ